MAKVIYLGCLTIQEFKAQEQVLFDGKTCAAKPGRFVFKCVVVKRFLHHRDDGETSVIKLIHDKRLDTGLLVNHLLRCNLKRNCTYAELDHHPTFSSDHADILMKMREDKIVFRFTDPRFKEDFAWGVAPRNIFTESGSSLITIPHHFYPRIKSDQIVHDENECKVCLTKPKSMMLLHPCGHYCVCARCSLQLSHCPLCRTLIGRRRIFHEPKCKWCFKTSNLMWCKCCNVILCQDCNPGDSFKKLFT